MKKIDEYELKDILENQNHLTDREIEFNTNFELEISHLKKFSFKNCSFRGSDIFFINFLNKNTNSPSIYFHNCSFHNDQINITNCNFNNIYFNRTYIKGEINIRNSEIEHLNFTDNCKVHFLDLFDVKIKHRFIINRKNNFERLLISNSKFENEVTFFNSNFKDLEISNSTFHKSFNFNKNIINNVINIDSNLFNTINFDSNTLMVSGETHRFNLLKNTFNDIASFSNIKGLKTVLFIRDCTFNQFARFNNSEFKTMHIEQTSFINISSFQDTKFKTVFIDRTNFEKSSFFDNISILEIEQCNKRTLRNIKHQLQRTNNKIDFDIFKAYELNSHRKELAKSNKFWFNNKDAFILSIGNLFSKNGMNWIRALIVTLLGSFILYSVFYWIYINHFKITLIDFNELEPFFNGFTKFLIPTNIYNPLIDREYVTGISWVPFIIGKIFLTIGIYEIINSFRKFKN